MKETYKFQYDNWHQDTPESRDFDISSSFDFIDMHGVWPSDEDARIFDVGCGMGRFLLAYRKRGFNHLSGIDIDEYQVKIAKKENLNVKLIDASDYFNKNSNQYELVTMVDCLEHVEKDKQIELLKNINSSLSKDGMLLIRVPNALAPAFAYFRYDDFTHKWSFTTKSLSYVLRNAGFECIVFRPAWRETEDIVKHKIPHAQLLKAEFGISNPILTSNMVAVAFKSKKAYDAYIKNAPELDINYKDKKSWLQKLTSR